MQLESEPLTLRTPDDLRHLTLVLAPEVLPTRNRRDEYRDREGVFCRRGERYPDSDAPRRGRVMFAVDGGGGCRDNDHYRHGVEGRLTFSRLSGPVLDDSRGVQ